MRTEYVQSNREMRGHSEVGSGTAEEVMRGKNGWWWNQRRERVVGATLSGVQKRLEFIYNLV